MMTTETAAAVPADGQGLRTISSSTAIKIDSHTAAVALVALPSGSRGGKAPRAHVVIALPATVHQRVARLPLSARVAPKSLAICLMLGHPMSPAQQNTHTTFI